LGYSTHRAAALDLEAATCGVSSKVSFFSERVLVQHFLTSVQTNKGIFHREMGLKKFMRRWVPHFLSLAQKVVRVEASTQRLRILDESEENHFERIPTGGESWFQYSYPSPKMLARSPTDVIPRMRQAIGTK
jgi:hypothetical protein